MSDPTEIAASPTTGPFATAIAKFDFVSGEEGKLNLRKGEVVRVVDKDESGWWYGLVTDAKTNAVRNGWFPASYIDEISTPAEVPPPPPIPSGGFPDQTIAAAPDVTEPNEDIVLKEETAPSQPGPSPKEPVAESAPAPERFSATKTTPSHATPSKAPKKRLKNYDRDKQLPSIDTGMSRRPSELSNSSMMIPQTQLDAHISDLVRSISHLNRIASTKDKNQLLNSSKDVVSSIKLILSDAGIGAEPAVVVDEKLAAIHQELMRVLSELVMLVKTIVQEGDDADSTASNADLRTLSSDILLNVRRFVSVTIEKEATARNTPAASTPLHNIDLNDLYRQLDHCQLRIKLVVDDLLSNIQFDAHVNDTFRTGAQVVVFEIQTLEGILDGLPLFAADESIGDSTIANQFRTIRYSFDANLAALEKSANSSNLFGRKESVLALNNAMKNLIVASKSSAELVSVVKRLAYELTQGSGERRGSDRSLISNDRMSDKSVKVAAALKQTFPSLPRIDTQPPSPITDRSSVEQPHPEIISSSRKSSDSKLRKFFGEAIPDDFATEEEQAPSSSYKLKSFFGEEAGEIRLNRISARSMLPSPAWLGADYAPGDLIFNMEGNNLVKSGTLVALVERLTSHDAYDSDFTRYFLLTFKRFTTAERFLGALRQRLLITPPADLSPPSLKQWTERKQKPVHFRVFRVLKKWLEDYWYDEVDVESIPMIMDFASTELATFLPSEAQRILELCTRRTNMTGKEQYRSKLSFADSMERPVPAPPSPIQILGTKEMKFTDLDPLEAARQLTIIESRLFAAVHPMDVLFYKAESPDARSPTDKDAIRSMIHHSNQVTAWTQEMILREDNIRNRAAVLKFFIKLAEKCHALNNFATRDAVISGLHSTPVYRLKQTWELISPKTRAVFDTLVKHMDPKNNYQTYRNLLRTAKPPVIPFLGLFLKDVTFMDQGNPDKVGEDGRLINFDKNIRLAAVVRFIQRLQADRHHFVVLQQVQDYLNHQLRMVRDQTLLHELSLAVEPKTSGRPSIEAIHPAEDAVSLFNLSLSRM